MKTRTNQPIILPSTTDIEHLSDAFIDQLKCGDIIIKKTGEQRHSYRVSYKQEKHGICLTYVDCGYMETISYDYTNGHWVFNSKDVCEVPSDAHIEDVVEEMIANGQIKSSTKYYDDAEVHGSSTTELHFNPLPASVTNHTLLYIDIEDANENTLFRGLCYYHGDYANGIGNEDIDGTIVQGTIDKNGNAYIYMSNGSNMTFSEGNYSLYIDVII